MFLNIKLKYILIKKGRWKRRRIKEEKLIINPIYVTKEEKTNHIDLLIIKDELMNSHYCWIKDFEKLVSNQISKNGHKIIYM